VAEYVVGEMIRRLRTQKGITQEELARSLLERGHLSKIERGQTIPNKKTLEMLFERLGHNPAVFVDFMVDEETAKIQSIMNELDSFLKRKKIQEVDLLIAQLENEKNFESNKFYTQYLLSAKAGSLKKAIDLMAQLKKNFDNRYMDNISKGMHYPMVIYNLTKYLGMAGMYEESIDLCDIGKKVCLDINALRMLPLITLNKACCLYEIGDKESCEKLLRQSYYASEMYERYDTKDIIKNYAKDKLGIVFR